MVMDLDGPPRPGVSFQRIVAVTRHHSVRCPFRRQGPQGTGRRARVGLARHIARHEAAWAERWRHSDVAIDGATRLRSGRCASPSTT